MVDHIVVVGQMGVGKSTLATALAARMGRSHLDSDVAIEELTGMTGRELAAARGVEALHARELSVLQDQLARPRPAVVSAAASVLDAPAGRDALAAHTVVWLDLPVPDLLARIRTGPHRRTITREVLADLDRRRRPHLERLADLRLDAGRPPAELVTDALELVTSR